MVILNNQINEIISFAGEHSPFWKERLKGRKFHEIPVLKKSELPMIQRNGLPFGGLTAVPMENIARIFMSPGPIYDPQGKQEDYWRFSEALEIAGFGPGDLVLNTFSYHLSPAGFMFDSALRKLGVTVIPAGVGNTDLQVQILKDCKVTGYVGTPSFLAALLEKAREARYQLGDDLQISKAFFTAEKLSDSLKKDWVENGISVFEGYGTADAGCIAYEDGENKGLRIHSSVFVELCDPETGHPIEKGEMGEVVITLMDKTYPLIRFGTGDLSSWTPGEEGRYLTGVLGRVGDGIKVRGMFVHMKQFAPLLEEYPEIKYYQCVVNREGNRDTITFYLEGIDDSFSVDSLQQRLKNVIRVSPDVVGVPLHSLSRSEAQFIDKRKWD
ncbi:AMP-binding protein [Microaerobacter geothermalis]|uniref:phenylacetate--CoA ligase family protein n=1 Tax=Microaerobacter geothermalis TaxID=674972 RepID=UPI001F23E5BB|nr:AMP-binding protein [Microaerobacter geothermalis]MCF6095001.1 AMP-binding protein [Microaerobacter geothermalis]